MKVPDVQYPGLDRPALPGAASYGKINARDYLQMKFFLKN
jgi:hypothetical protein